MFGKWWNILEETFPIYYKSNEVDDGDFVSGANKEPLGDTCLASRARLTSKSLQDSKLMRILCKYTWTA